MAEPESRGLTQPASRGGHAGGPRRSLGSLDRARGGRRATGRDSEPPGESCQVSLEAAGPPEGWTA